MLLGKRIKSLRKEKGLTQEELGKIINVTKVSICCYERESRVPTLETLIALAEVFGVDVDYLLGNDVYAVAEDSDKYGTYVAKEEIRKHNNLYDKMISDPKRCVEWIDMKMR